MVKNKKAAGNPVILPLFRAVSMPELDLRRDLDRFFEVGAKMPGEKKPVTDEASKKSWVDGMVDFAKKNRMLTPEALRHQQGVWEVAHLKREPVAKVAADLGRMANKVANNMLEFLVNPRVIPVEKRLYFGPEERLQNESFEAAEADAKRAYGEQRKNSDFYPDRNRNQPQREASLMDRRTMIASMDILSQTLGDNDPIATDLRTMAQAVSEMSDDAFAARLAAKTFKCPTCGTKVLEQTKFCVKCKKKVSPGTDKKADQNSSHPQAEGMAPAAPVMPEPPVKDEEAAAPTASTIGTWNKSASEAVRRLLIAEVTEEPACPKDEKKPEEKPAAPVAEKPAEVPVEKKAEEKKPEEKKPEETVEVPAAPAAAPAPMEPSPTASVVDTDVLVASSFDGVEISAGMMTADDVVLSAAEKAQLDSLFA